MKLYRARFHYTSEMNITLMDMICKLPFDVVINHIIPYTYETKPVRHLLDIRTYVADYSFLENVYNIDFNDEILLYDLVSYCNNGKFPTWGLEPKYDAIIRRHIMYKTIKDSDLQLFIFMKFHRKIDDASERKICFIWGLLTPKERTDFINKYIIDKLEIE